MMPSARRLLIVVLLCYPYVFILSIIAPSNLPFGKNVYVAALTMLTIAAFLLERNRMNRGITAVVTVLAPVAVGIIVVRHLVFGEDFMTVVFVYRSPLLLPVYACAAWGVIRASADRQLFQSVIIGSAIVQAVAGIVHYHWFSNIVVGPAVQQFFGVSDLYYTSDQALSLREAGLLISPSVYGNFVLLGMFLVVNRALSGRRRRLRILPTAQLALLLYAVSLSGSRYPIVAGFAVTGFYLLKHVRLRTLLPAAVVAGFVVAVLMPAGASLISRLEAEGSGGRVEKARLALSLVTADASTLLMGVPIRIQGDAMTDEGLQISDNSALALAMGFGVPFTLAFALGMSVIIARTIRPAPLRSALILHLAIVLALTNAIVWDIWLLFWFATAYALEPVESRQVVASPMPQGPPRRLRAVAWRAHPRGPNLAG